MKTRSTRPKKGFSLVEVLVALTLLSIIFMGLARVSFQLAASARNNSTVAKRTAVIIQEANKFNAMAYASLSAYNNTTATLRYGDVNFQRRMTVTAQTTDLSRYLVKIVITPYIGTTLTTSLKDSTWVYRSNPPGSPLCTGC